MKKPDERVLKSIAKLKGNEFFDVILKWIKESKEDAFVSAIKANRDVDIFRGRAQELEDLNATIDNAVNMLNNFK